MTFSAHHTEAPLFGLGVVTMSPAALEQLSLVDATAAQVLNLHVQGRWADIDVRDRTSNYEALARGTGAIVGRFRTGGGLDDFVVALTYPDQLTLLVTLPQAAKILGAPPAPESARALFRLQGVA